MSAPVTVHSLPAFFRIWPIRLSGHFSLRRAFFASMVLHAFVMLIYPRLQQPHAPALTEKLSVELLSVQQAPMPAQPPTVVPPPTSQTPPNPAKPVQQRVLASSQSDSPQQVLATPPVINEPVSPQTPPTPLAATTASPPVAAPVSESAPTSAQTAARSETSDDSEVSDEDAWDGYGQQLHALVSKSKSYPAIAIRRHLEGDVKVLVQFVRGELERVQVLTSSGHPPLDEEAIRMVKKAITQMAVKASWSKKTFKVTIPVNFRLE